MLAGFIQEVKNYPAIPVALTPCVLGAGYVARIGMRLCHSAVTIDKVKGAAAILGAVYLACGIVIAVKVLLISPDQFKDIREQLKQASRAELFIDTLINVALWPKVYQQLQPA